MLTFNVFYLQLIIGNIFLLNNYLFEKMGKRYSHLEYFKILIRQFQYVKSPHVFKDHCDSPMVQYSISLTQWIVKNELAYLLKN
jgi:hypothetical protein